MLDNYIHIVFEKEYGEQSPYSDHATVIGAALVIRYPPHLGTGWRWEMQQHYLDSPQQILTLRGSKLWNTTPAFHHEDDVTSSDDLYHAIVLGAHRLMYDGWSVSGHYSDTEDLIKAGLLTRKGAIEISSRDRGYSARADGEPDMKQDASTADFIEV